MSWLSFPPYDGAKKVGALLLPGSPGQGRRWSSSPHYPALIPTASAGPDPPGSQAPLRSRDLGQGPGAQGGTGVCIVADVDPAWHVLRPGSTSAPLVPGPPIAILREGLGRNGFCRYWD